MGVADAGVQHVTEIKRVIVGDAGGVPGSGEYQHHQHDHGIADFALAFGTEDCGV
ncbi:hypothetical protein D3C75_1268810 [compost metagenome]